MNSNKLARRNGRRNPSRSRILNPRTMSIGLDSQRPPPYIANYKGYKVFRFMNPILATNTVYSINAAKLGALISIGTVVNTTVRQLFSEVKVKYVEVWSAYASATPAQVAVTFPGFLAGSVGDSKTKSDAALSQTWVAHVKVKPPKLSQAAQWQTADNNSLNIANALFTIEANQPVIIDVGLSFTIPPTARGSAGDTSVATAVLGYIYYLALDNACSASLSGTSQLVPDESLNTTK